MEVLAEILFWLSFLALAHTYLLYPALMYWLSRGKHNNTLVFDRADDLPDVSVIMSVYNEAKVIAGKMDSLVNQNYPAAKMRLFIGSDGSSDHTDAILADWAVRYDHIRFFAFPQRRGKPQVINHLAGLAVAERPAAAGHIFLITDANVILSPDALWYLARHFRNERVAVVDAHMVHTGVRASGISKAENAYISSEVMLKHREGIVWGKMIGPFGGCYTLRSPYFRPVPPKYLVDDFYIAMRAMEAGGDAISELKAVCYEAVSHEIREEYRRKSRISAGNFQNLLTFRHLWWPPLRPLAFAFFSHKVLRWFGPFQLIVILGTGLSLAWNGNLFYRFLFLSLIAATLGLPALDLVLKILKINILPLRGVRYFMLMNIALLEGFFKFVNGIQSNVWEPPKRN